MKDYKWRLVIDKGGRGSGNFGHAGRPGLIGGSAPGGYMGKLERALGDSLIIESEQAKVKDLLLSLAQIPSAVLERAASLGIKVYVGDKPVTGMDDMQYLKGVQPRGWDDGKTWDTVAGCYGNEKVIVGRGEGGGMGSLVGHEFGHAVCRSFGIDNNPRNISLHKKLFPKLYEYYQQDGPGGVAGRQELGAETLSILWRHGRQRAVGFSSQEYVEFLESMLRGK